MILNWCQSFRTQICVLLLWNVELIQLIRICSYFFRLLRHWEVGKVFVYFIFCFRIPVGWVWLLFWFWSWFRWFLLISLYFLSSKSSFFIFTLRWLFFSLRSRRMTSFNGTLVLSVFNIVWCFWWNLLLLFRFLVLWLFGVGVVREGNVGIVALLLKTCVFAFGGGDLLLTLLLILLFSRGFRGRFGPRIGRQVLGLGGFNFLL